MKKRILPVAVLLIVALAVFLPQLLYYYSDTSYLNQVKYSDKNTGSVNLEMASTAKTKTIDQKLDDLNSIITDKEYAKKKVEVLFDPSENELKTIRKNVKKQINYWLELFGCKELINNKKTIKLVPKNIVIQKCYSIVGESASFPYLEATATLSKNPKIMATVYLDNTTNKIYDIKITGDNVESMLSYAKQNAEKNKLTLINLDTFQKEIIEQLSDYYNGIYVEPYEQGIYYNELADKDKETKGIAIVDKDENYIWQCEIISGLVWRVELGKKSIEVGMRLFKIMLFACRTKSSNTTNCIRKFINLIKIS